MASKEAATRRLLFVCVAALLACHALADDPQCESGSLRLPKRVKPSLYDVRVSLDWEKLQFKGRVAIDIEFDDAAAKSDLVCKYIGTPSPSCDTKKIILHAGKELEIETVEFERGRTSLFKMIPIPGTGSKLAPVNFCRDSSNNQLIVELDRAFDSSGQLVLTYTGQLKKEVNKGFFLSEAHDSQGASTPLWVTSLEPGWARTVLPCFDEPDLKATFKVTIEHPQGLTALSNMHEIGRAESNGRTEVTFEQTPKMSTYLFAVAIGKMDHIETKPSNGKITFRAWAPPGRAEEARESLELIVTSYESFVKYFGVEQPLKKIDFISIQRSYGGTENWGLVTVHPYILLDGPERRQISFFLQSVHDRKSTIVHEMAHFWFGNLVTMKWWDDLWLNEGFATLMASIETNRMFPELGGKHFDLIYEQSEVLESMTETEFAHPIKQSSLQSMDDIIKSFNVVIYNKASAVLKMVRNYMGDELFQTGVQNYIKKFMYKNTEAKDLWNSLDEASGKIGVGEIMDSWIQNEGFPLVEVSLEPNWLVFKQKKFPLSKEESDDGKRWQIPLSFLISDGQEKTEMVQFLFDSGRASIMLPDWFEAGAPGHFVKVNKDFEGLYRVIYSDDLLQALKDPVENRKILSHADRMNLLDDYLALSKVDLTDRDQLRDLTSWFKDEEHELVLMSLMSILDSYTRNIKQNDDCLAILKDYFHDKLESTLNVPEGDLFGNNENLLQTMVRARVIYSLVRSNYEPAVNFSLEYFRSRQGKVAHHMMEPIYSGVALAGTDEELARIKRLAGELSGGAKPGLMKSIFWVLEADVKRLDDFDELIW